MEINKLGSIAQEYKQVSSQRQEKGPALKEGEEQQTVAAGASVKSMPQKAVAPGDKAAQGQNNPPQGQPETTAQVSASTVSALTASDDDDDSSYQEIVTKADSGQTLTASELATLRSKDPARYNKAVKAQNARQNLRSEMEKNPSAANKVAKEAIAAIKAEGNQTSALQAHGTIDTNALVSALNDEYNSFAKQYDQVVFERPAIEE